MVGAVDVVQDNTTTSANVPVVGGGGGLMMNVSLPLEPSSPSRSAAKGNFILLWLH